MKKILIIVLSFSFSGLLHSQVKTIKGIVYDSYTNAHIPGVHVTPSLYTDSVTTNQKGRFRAALPKKFKDNLVFSHPDYYPHIERIGTGDAARLKLIKMIPRSFKLDTICYIAYQENTWLSGLIKDSFTQEFIYNAEIRLENNMVIAYSGEDGRFEVALPKSNKNLIVNHPGYKTSTHEVKRSLRPGKYMEIWLDRKNPVAKDTVSVKQDNIIGLSVNELFTGSIGLNYEHIFGFNHGVGIFNSNYLFGIGYLPLFNQGTARFTGIKLSPYYSYYFVRKMRKGAFVTGKLNGGYFDISNLYYYYPVDSRYGEYHSAQFYSFGFGVGIGMISILPKMEHVFFKFYVGYQFFRIDVPATFESDRYGTLKVEDQWWYVMGPGSFLELKIVFGGIF